MVQGTLRVNTSKGQVDRVVYLSPDVATALRQWHRLQSATADYVFPSPGCSCAACRSGLGKSATA